jgi:hypothetical protein
LHVGIVPEDSLLRLLNQVNQDLLLIRKQL